MFREVFFAVITADQQFLLNLFSIKSSGCFNIHSCSSAVLQLKKTLPVHIVLDVILISLVVLSRCVEKKELSAGAGEPHAECGMCKLLRNQRYILYKSLEPPNFFLISFYL